MSEPMVEIVTLVVRVGTHALTVSPAEAVALRDALLKQFPVEKEPWTPHFARCRECGMTHDIDYGCVAKTQAVTLSENQKRNAAAFAELCTKASTIANSENTNA